MKTLFLLLLTAVLLLMGTAIVVQRNQIVAMRQDIKDLYEMNRLVATAGKMVCGDVASLYLRMAIVERRQGDTVWNAF
jgi:hypothetical protein